MFRKTVRGIAPLGVLLVVLVLATGSAVVVRGATWSVSQGQRASSTTQVGGSPQSARCHPLQTPHQNSPRPHHQGGAVTQRSTAHAGLQHRTTWDASTVRGNARREQTFGPPASRWGAERGSHLLARHRGC